MASRILSKPMAGETARIVSEGDANLQLAFDPASATFTREGADLVVTFDNGSETTLPDFFNSDTLPDITLMDGSTVPGVDFLKTMDPDMDLATAAGPAGNAAAPGGGLGEYADDSGSLISGVDRLGSLGTSQWARDTETPELPVAAVIADAAAIPGGGTIPGGSQTPESDPSTPDSDPTPSYTARAVLYHTTDDAGNSLRFYLLDENGQPVKAQGNELDGATIVSENGLLDTASIIWNPDGTFSISLTPDVIAMLMASGGGKDNLFDYITFTVNGHTYTMQVVINFSGVYTPDDAEADRAAGAPLYGEWHSETKGSGTGDRESGGGHDEVWLSGKNNVMSGMALNTGDGNDTVHAQGSIRADSKGQSNTLALGDGDNSLDVSASVWAQGGGVNTITGGKDTDIVEIKNWVYATGEGSKNVIDTGAGEKDLLHVAQHISAQDGGANTLKTGGTLLADANVEAWNAGKNTLHSGGDMHVGGRLYAVRGENTLTSDGSIVINESKGDSNVEAWYANGKNTVEAAKDATVHSKILAYYGQNEFTAGETLTVNGEVHARYDGAKNTLTAENIIVDNKNSWGVTTHDKGASNELKSVKDITITAADEGVSAWNGASATLAAGGDVTIKALGSAKSGSGEVEAVYSYAAGSTIDIHAGQTIIIKADTQSGNTRAVGAKAMNGGSVALTADQGDIDITVTAEGANQGGWGVSGYQSEMVLDAGRDVSIKVNAGHEAIGIFGGAQITAGRNVDIQVDAKSGSITERGAQGLHIHGTGKADIKAEGDVTIGARNENGDAAAILTYDRSNVVIDAATIDLSATAKGAGNAYGVRTERPNAGYTTSTTLEADTVTVTADASASTGNAYGLYSQGVHYDIHKTTDEKGDLRYAATNKIIADEVAITARAGQGAAAAMYATGGVSTTTSKDISAVNKIISSGNVTLTATGAAASGTVSGMESVLNSKNSINALGEVRITAAYGTEASGMRADKGGNNTVAADSVVIDAHDAVNNYGMLAKNGGTNLIEGHAGMGLTVVITATAGSGDKFAALWAETSGASNTIKGSSLASKGTQDHITLNGGMYAGSGAGNYIVTGSGDDVITITGGISGNGNNWITTNAGNDIVSIQGDISGKVRIDTGADDDTIILDGHVQAGSLTILAGTGHDTLILCAPNAEDFHDYYAAWLQALSKSAITNMSIEEVTVRLHDVNGVTVSLDDIEWLNDYLPITAVETGAGNDVLHMEGAHGLTVDTGAGDDALYLGNAHDIRAFLGDGDDWLHIDADAHGNALDGGEGNDMLHLSLNGQTGSVTDQAASFFGQNTITGFESLLLDMSGNAQDDRLDLDALLGNGALPGNADQLFIKGDATDSVSSNASWTLVDGAGTITMDGVEYAAWINSDQQTVYLQVGLTFM